MKKIITKVLRIIYWVIVATIPLLAWYIGNSYQSEMECILTKTCLTLDGASKLIPIFVVYASILLLPLCVIKIFLVFKKSSNEKEPNK